MGGMKVYLVYGVWHYEGSDLLGVYDSMEKAERRAEEARGKPAYEGLPGFFDEVRIREREVE